MVRTHRSGRPPQSTSRAWWHKRQLLRAADTSNYYPLRDGSIPAIDSGGMTESEWVSEQIGHQVIKAWNFEV